MSPSNHPHTYGPGCQLSPGVSFTCSRGDDDIPPLKAQFFYASGIGIDDPLSAVPIPSSKTKTPDHPPRPFSAYDNTALDEAWMSFSENGKKQKNKKKGPLLATHTSVARGPSPLTKSANEKPKLGKEEVQKASNSKEDRKLPAHSSSGEVPSGDPSCHVAADETPESPVSPQKGLMNIFKKEGTKEHSGTDRSDEVNKSNQGGSKPESKENTSLDSAREQKDKLCNKFCNDKHHSEPDMHLDCCGEFERLHPPRKIGKTNIDTTKPSKKSEEALAQEEMHVQDLDYGSESMEGQREGLKLHKPKKSNSKGKRVSKYADTKFDEAEEAFSDKTLPLKSKHQDDDCQKSQMDSKSGQNLSEAQGDGINDSPFLPDDDQDIEGCQDSKEHDTIKKHTECKSHQAFEAHFQTKHDGAEQKKDAKENKSKHSRSYSPKHDKYPKDTPSTQEREVNQTSSLPVPNVDAKTTGRPFLRLPSRRSGLPTKPEFSQKAKDGPLNDDHKKENDGPDEETMHVLGCKAQKNTKDQIDVPVGISRLHHVQLPSLQMKPIYWSPVHDMATVTRGTWFYNDTMYPVEPAVANQLEMGYKELRPWSETWSDELRSAIEVGAEAEEKIAHQLWYADEGQKSSSNKKSDHIRSADPYCAARCFNGEAAAEGISDLESTEPKPPVNMKAITKRYPNSQVIFKDSKNAFILKPTLQPSAYYGRKPLQKIKKGQTVGIHVVRGFNWEAWDKIHPSKKNHFTTKAEDAAPVGVDNGGTKRSECVACKHEEERPKVTDVIFVIHGIGQKLSERMESFHFTHAINAFRRSVNLEISHHGVQKVLREDLGGIMVLPINWRTNLSFEDGGPMKEEDRKSPDQHFALEDITPTTIPAVRNMISDVMLDIPFYMSHHKPKMVQAVIAEANRVYRLWCQNNPNFVKEGRVHIIAHSLGSAMALDILSKQPTSAPKYNPSAKKLNMKSFDFNTTNLFLAGSPAGFFLFLEKAMLLPRKGQNKPGVEPGDDQDKALVGDAGAFGCLAVDNIYNVMHYNDPIAYRMNAAVDPQYAASLKNAQVPSSTVGFFESIGNAIRSKKTSGDLANDLSTAKPPGIARLPSQLEMEVHDFTREEIAEKKFWLLNDNGQIDWFLSSGGGPLEIQYINMLGAHSSYWLSQDFVRFIVVETGRRPGKSHSLQHMKVVKEHAKVVKTGHKS
jgi:hypothetical protein